MSRPEPAGDRHRRGGQARNAEAVGQQVMDRDRVVRHPELEGNVHAHRIVETDLPRFDELHDADGDKALGDAADPIEGVRGGRQDLLGVPKSEAFGVDGFAVVDDRDAEARHPRPFHEQRDVFFDPAPDLEMGRTGWLSLHPRGAQQNGRTGKQDADDEQTRCFHDPTSSPAVSIRVVPAMALARFLSDTNGQALVITDRIWYHN